jgi:hypothetical protein
MRFFQQLGRWKNDPLRGKAERLVSSAKVNAVTMFLPMLDQHPLLKKVNPEQWDFLLTVAGVFMAATRLQNLQVRVTCASGAGPEERHSVFVDVVMCSFEQRRDIREHGFSFLHAAREHEAVASRFRLWHLDFDAKSGWSEARLAGVPVARHRRQTGDCPSTHSGVITMLLENSLITGLLSFATISGQTSVTTRLPPRER